MKSKPRKAQVSPLRRKRPRPADPVVEAVRTAPLDDEPVSESERADADLGRAELQRGDAVGLDELRRRLSRRKSGQR